MKIVETYKHGLLITYNLEVQINEEMVAEVSMPPLHQNFQLSRFICAYN